MKNGRTPLTQKSIQSLDVFVVSSTLWEKASPLYMTFLLIKHLKRRLPQGRGSQHSADRIERDSKEQMR